MASISCVSNFPARPTKGSPWRSSSWPGPSPTKTSSAVEPPAPKTMLVRFWQSLQRLQSPMSARMRSRVSPATRSAASNKETDLITGKTGAGGCSDAFERDEGGTEREDGEAVAALRATAEATPAAIGRLYERFR